MVAFTLKNCQKKVLIVGPIYNRIEKIQKIKEIEHNYQYIIFNGNICYPYDNVEELEKRLDYFNMNNQWIFNVGQYDLTTLLNPQISDKVRQWINSKPNVVILEFVNNTNLIIIGGGLTKSLSKNDLLDNLEVSFVSKIENENWHKFYGGGFGYIISNNPLTDKEPEFYNYSLQMGNTYDSNKTYAQEADQYGLKKTILL